VRIGVVLLGYHDGLICTLPITTGGTMAKLLRKEGSCMPESAQTLFLAIDKHWEWSRERSIVVNGSLVGKFVKSPQLLRCSFSGVLRIDGLSRRSENRWMPAVHWIVMNSDPNAWHSDPIRY
jgi:hypothetical protein